VTLEPMHTPLPAGALALDVWLEIEPGTSLEPRLGDALDVVGGRLLGVDAANGSLWPLPVVYRVPGTKVRIARALGDDVPADAAIATMLRAVRDVADWSLVQRLDGRSGARDG
jgi:hypothetical protein